MTRGRHGVFSRPVAAPARVSPAEPPATVPCTRVSLRRNHLQRFSIHGSLSDGTTCNGSLYTVPSPVVPSRGTLRVSPEKHFGHWRLCKCALCTELGSCTGCTRRARQLCCFTACSAPPPPPPPPPRRPRSRPRPRSVHIVAS